MSKYFISHPDLEITAEVDAPSTEKARTTFLDYLERTGRIKRGQRQFYRKNMGTNKVDDDSSVTADVELDYMYEEVQEATSIAPPVLGKEGFWPGVESPVELEVSDMPIDKAGRQLSPIERFSLEVG